jgi:serine/threonine-protein kinase
MLSSGSKIGQYEVVNLIGAGGMGEVYRAHDTRLNRDVALKVLPEAFARDAQRMARFEREAKVLASLNHPNIAAIYGLEESGPIRALVMELVEGPTLAERILSAPMPVDETLPIARQVADAVEYAHDKNVIHRDLKPANIKVTAEGTVKVLDFGLAKALSDEVAAEDMSNSPTLSMAATRQGVILGTAAYMSPEQAKGKTVDRRADVWAFGAVLYEMLAGKQAFHGEDVTEILAAVVRADPDWNRLPSKTPPAIRTLLRRCLEKNLKRRLAHIAEARIALEDVASGAAPAEAVSAAPGKNRERLAWAAAAALTLLFAMASWGWWRATRPVEPSLRPLVHLDVALESDASPGAFGGTNAILSPDGTRLVYASQGRLFARRLDQPNAVELPGTQGAGAPFFSPDGQWVGFFAQGKLKKISVEGGAAVSLCDASSPRGASWGEDGNIIASLSTNGGLSRIPSAGGTPAPATELANGELTHRWPQVLPGGKAILFTAHTRTTGFDGATIEVMTLADRRRKTLQRGGSFGRYLPSGHLIYVNNNTLFAVRFDLDRLEVIGTPVPVLEKVRYNPLQGAAQFDFSQAGTLLYQSGSLSLLTVQWMDSAGKTQPLLSKPGVYSRPHISPDGQRLAMDVTEGSGTDIWIYELQRDTMTRLTFNGANQAIWSPDGRYLVFQDKDGLSWTRSDGAGKPQSLVQSKGGPFTASFAPDGKRLGYIEAGAGGAYDIFTVSLENDASGLRPGKPEPYLQTPFDERSAMFSPDGRWIAYVSNESGSYQVFVRAFPDKGGKWQISNSSGFLPIWSRNGHELFFHTEDNQIMVASYREQGDSFIADKPRAWSDKTIANVGVLTPNYDLAPDGKSVAALMPAQTAEAQNAQSHVIFLENFFDEVRRRVKP